MLTVEQEHEIVRQVLNGDVNRFAVIVKEYQIIVANLCYKLAGDKLDIEEVTQQVFVELYNALPRFRYESRLSTYIYRITVNVVSKEVKHNSKIISYDASLERSNADYQTSREEELMKEEQRRKLHQAIGRLKHEQRTAIVLYAFNDFSYNDIADVMQVSLSKVESLIFRAKKNLKKMMT
ncbi:MAG: sigma-70 family RNA polymerase sigma factor [Bacteroidales bacterium]|nr:sigma-70 family RNA polymerase sigma factor [Bacteroidales bacterium]